MKTEKPGKVPIDQHSRMHEYAKEFRKFATPAEKVLWENLSRRKIGGYKFRRQHPIGPFITDFCCPELKLVIEVDGAIHQSRQEFDESRSLWLNEKGYTVIRFSNEQVLENTKTTIIEITNMIKSLSDGKLPKSLPD
ncbi:MAG: hypothetical protein CVU39_25465 [Chloroflexi bacterium HGW-Chloroflexi-10]|nr:MAG: hypothetical protein CVU39_25465 [Chloroflexi bacterium HGW-Chloroflexi-10]